jgi:uncharacterized SAM-dependent methyltransferase
MSHTMIEAARDSVGIAPQPRRPAARLVAAVRDALSRRQRELPAAFLADPGIAVVRREVERLAARRWQQAEVPLLERWMATARAARHVRRVVELLPAGSSTVHTCLQAAGDLAPAGTYLAVDPSVERAHEAASRVSAAIPDVAVHALAADPALMLPIRCVPGSVLAVLSGALGRLTPLLAIRTLRAVRAAMSLDDTLLIGLDLRSPGMRLANPDAPAELLTRWHGHALAVANRDAGTDFVVERYSYAARHDVEHRRMEEGVSSESACRVHVPGAEPVPLRRGELVRTSVQCCYDRTMLESMLRGVGLCLDEWHESTDATHALAVARVRFPDDGQP